MNGPKPTSWFGYLSRYALVEVFLVGFVFKSLKPFLSGEYYVVDRIHEGCSVLAREGKEVTFCGSRLRVGSSVLFDSGSFSIVHRNSISLALSIICVALFLWFIWRQLEK